jgi:transposase-like protein
MSIVMEEEIKRWAARRKSALVLEVIQGKTSISEATRQFDLPPLGGRRQGRGRRAAWRTPSAPSRKTPASSTGGS